MMDDQLTPDTDHMFIKNWAMIERGGPALKPHRTTLQSWPVGVVL